MAHLLKYLFVEISLFIEKLIFEFVQKRIRRVETMKPKCYKLLTVFYQTRVAGQEVRKTSQLSYRRIQSIPSPKFISYKFTSIAYTSPYTKIDYFSLNRIEGNKANTLIYSGGRL